MKTVNRQYRQGDVLVTPIAAIPAGAISTKHAPRIILAEGEATGHAHAIRTKRSKIKTYLHNSELYLEVLQPVTLEHEEHAPAVLEPGYYVVRRQVEQWLDEVRQVAD